MDRVITLRYAGMCQCGVEVPSGVAVRYRKEGGVLACPKCEPALDKPAGAADASASGLVTFRASVCKIRWTNPEGSWVVASVSVREDIEVGESMPAGTVVSVVGPLGAIRAGDEVIIVGGPRQGKYGREILAAGPAQHAITESLLALRAFLQRFPGVGPVRAEAIIAHFGGKDQVIAVLETRPEDLAQVRGIALERAVQLGEAYKQARALKDAYLFLGGLEMTPGDQASVLDVWAGEAEVKIRRDPYDLMREIGGVGWPTADRIGVKLGLARDDPRRLRAAVEVVLQNAASNGHTWVPTRLFSQEPPGECRDEIKDMSRLGLTLGEWQGALEHAKEAHFVEATDNGRVALASLAYAERGLATRLACLARADLEPLEIPDDAWGPLIPAPEQIEALDLAANAAVFVLTGRPGTGKTSIIKALIRLYEHNRLSVALAAPTGKAASRMMAQTGREAATVHRLLGLKPGDEAVFDESNPLDEQVLIVDEMSMVGVGLAHTIVRAVAEGTRLVFVGDVDQLPSIEAGSVLDDLITSGLVPAVRLTKIFRTAAESAIPWAAKDIIEGRVPDCPATSDCVFLDLQTVLKGAERDVVYEVTAQQIEKAMTGELKRNPTVGQWIKGPHDIQMLAAQRSGVTGVDTMNARLQAALNPEAACGGGVYIRSGQKAAAGDRVIHKVNNYDLRIFNGELGLVLQADPEGIAHVFAATPDPSVTALLAGTDEGSSGPSTAAPALLGHTRGSTTAVVQYRDLRGEPRVVHYQKPDAKQLDLAYALTVHSFQGSQAPVIIIPVLAEHAYMLTRRLIYTAVTRAEKFVLLIGDKQAFARAVANTRDARRRTQLREFLEYGAERLGSGDRAIDEIDLVEPQRLPEILELPARILPGRYLVDGVRFDARRLPHSEKTYLIERPAEGRANEIALLNGASQATIRTAVRHRVDLLDKLMNLASDVHAAGRAYAAEFSKCYRCGRRLEDEVSKARGLGRDCYEHLFGAPALLEAVG